MADVRPIFKFSGNARKDLSMSKKLILVRYALEDEIPIDDSSENILAAYIPDELVDWIEENNFISELQIKESKGEEADIPVSIIKDESFNYVEKILQHVDNTLVRFVEEVKLQTKDGLLVSKALDEEFSNLLIWLKIREILKEKESQYSDDISIKLVVG